jgi:hypothetical protein
MNRRNFLSKLIGAAAVITVAPQVLASIKPEPTVATEGIIPYLVRTSGLPDRRPIIEYMEGVGWYSDQEKQMIADLREQMERSMMFGKIKIVDPPDKYYARADGIWSDQIQG